MTADDRHRIVAHSKSSSRVSDELEEELLSYGERKGLYRHLIRLYGECADFWKDLPESWQARALGMLAAGAVAGSAANVAAFLRSAKDSLSTAGLTLARLWRSEPWRYALYRVDSEEGDDLLHASEIDFADGPGTSDGAGGGLAESELLLYSPSSASLYREGRGLHFSLLWWNGLCYQTYGPVTPFRSMSAEDIAGYTRELLSGRRPGKERLRLALPPGRETMREAMRRDPIPYLALIHFSEVPAIIMRGVELVYCNGLVEGIELAFDDLVDGVKASGAKTVKFESVDDLSMIQVEGATPMPEPVIYHVPQQAKIHVVAFSDESYARARDALAGVVDLPERPQRRFSMTMHAAILRFLGGQSEADRLVAAFGEPDEEPNAASEAAGAERVQLADAPQADGEILPSKDELQAVMDRLVNNYNEGREESDEEIARSLDLDPELVGQMRTELMDSYHRALGEGRAADRFGLSPDAFDRLTRRGLPAVPGVLVLRPLTAYKSDEAAQALAEAAPLIRGSRWLLGRIARDGGLRSTKAGNLPVSVVEEAYQSGEIVRPHEDIDFHGSEELEALLHPHREADWEDLRELHHLLESLRLLSHDGKRFEVTPRGMALVDDALSLHRALLEGLLRTLEWRVASRAGAMVELEEGAGFLLYASHRLSHPDPDAGSEAKWIHCSRITERFLAAFPWVKSELEEQNFSFLADVVIRMRFIQFFGAGLGLLETRRVSSRKGPVDFDVELKTSSLFDRLFETSGPRQIR